MKVDRRSFLQLAAAGAAAVAMPVSAAMQKSGKTPDLSFIQLSDTHIPEDEGRAKAVVDAINGFSLPYDMVVHTGDLSEGFGGKDLKIARNVLKFSKPAYFVPGNSDVTFTSPEANEPEYEEIFGPCNRTTTPADGLRFAFFNSQCLSNRAGRAVNRRALDKLEKMLAGPMPTVMFCHATGLGDLYNNEMHRGWGDETMDEWTSIMKRGGVFAVLAGHFHRDEYHLANGIPFYICPPVVGWWGRQSTFRHWTLKNGMLTYRTVYV